MGLIIHVLMSAPEFYNNLMQNITSASWANSVFFRQLFWFGLDKCQVPTKTTLSSPLQLDRGEEIRRKAQRLRQGQEQSLTNYCHGQNRLNLERKGSLIHHQSNQSGIVRNKSRSSNSFPPPLPSSRAQLHSRFSTSSPPGVVQGDGEWGLRSVHHTLSLPLLVPWEEDFSRSSPAPA